MSSNCANSCMAGCVGPNLSCCETCAIGCGVCALGAYMCAGSILCCWKEPFNCVVCNRRPRAFAYQNRPEGLTCSDCARATDYPVITGDPPEQTHLRGVQ